MVRSVQSTIKVNSQEDVDNALVVAGIKAAMK